MKNFLDVEKYESNGQNVVTFMNEYEIRQKFIANVYTVLSLQVFIALVIVLVCYNSPFLHDLIYDKPFIIYLPNLIVLPIYFILICKESVRRSYPLNFILLLLFTLGLGLQAGFFSVLSTKETVFLALMLTGGSFCALTLIARMRKFDLTKYSYWLFGLSMVTLLLGLITISIQLILNHKIRFLNLFLITFFLLLTFVYIIYDTQLILGRHSIKLSEEEYIFATLQLYADIMNLFIEFLSLLNISNDS